MCPGVRKCWEVLLMYNGVLNIVILVLQYSVVVKGIERKLNDEGHNVTVLTDGFEKIRDLSGSTNIFILYLPGDVADKLEALERMSYVIGQVEKSGKNLILIGEAKDQSGLFKKLPSASKYAWLNRPVDTDALNAAIDSVIEGKPVAGAKKRILIVDDDPAYAKMIREWIRDEYQTSIVTAGMQAITFLLKNPVDMILLDYEMPVVDGPQVLQMLRQEPVTAGIPVIFLTGVGTKEAVERVMSLRPDGYILKSSARDNLLKYLHSKLG